MPRLLLAADNRFTIRVDKDHLANVLRIRRQQEVGQSFTKLTAIPQQGSLTDPTIGA